MKLSNYIDTRVVISVINNKTGYKKRFIYENLTFENAINLALQWSSTSSNNYYIYMIGTKEIVCNIWKQTKKYLLNKKEISIQEMKRILHK